MPDNNAQLAPDAQPPQAPAKPQPAKKQDADDYDRAHVPMEEEFDKARWTLPPWQPVVVALVIVGVVVAGVAWLARAKPQGHASIDNVNVAQVQPDSVLVAINVSLTNTGEKPMWIHTLKAQLKTDKGEFSDEAAPAVDVERYYQAFPDLKQNTLAALLPETKIAPGGKTAGTMVFSFPVSKEQFEQRKALTVTLQPYDQRAVVLTK